MPDTILRNGAKLRLEQAPELATHLCLDEIYNEKTLCGAKRPAFASYSVPAKVGRQFLQYLDGGPALHHVDCKRCHALYLKYYPTEYLF